MFSRMNPRTSHKIVVVGVDYSETGALALRQALEIASPAPGGELHAVHVAASYPSSLGFEDVPDTLAPLPEPGEVKTELERYLDRMVGEFANGRDPNEPLPVRVVGHLRFDSPAREIAEVARDLEAHLVVVGTQGRRGLARMVLGSVAEGVVRLSPCPVLVVRPRELADVPRIEPACEHCVRTRVATGGQRLFCRQHSEEHGPRHTYHQRDRMGADGSMPLVFHR
jgi:nucleotide-binding universal stress UspA family protein